MKNSKHLKLKLPSFKFPSVQLPHFHRGKTASSALFIFKLLLFAFIISVIGLNIAQDRIFGTNEEKRLRYKILASPFSKTAHEEYGHFLLSINKERAQREFIIAEELFTTFDSSNKRLLGKQSSPLQTWMSILARRQRLEDEVIFWKKTSEAFPDYQYAFLKLSTLNMQLGNTAKAYEYAKRVLYNLPNNKQAQKIMEKLD